MFLAAASWAAIALALWLAAFFGTIQLPTRFDPLSWHIHEMIFGFVLAAVTGFLLTAIPNWTGRMPVRGIGLALLAMLWLLGRIACLISADLPEWLAPAIDLAFPVTLLAVVAREIIAARNWRNLPMTAPLSVFAIADLLMHLEALDAPVPPGLGWRLGIAAPLILIAVIGGRIIPSFTRNWLVKFNPGRLPVPFGRFDGVVIGCSAIAIIAWIVAPLSTLTGVAMALVGGLHLVRLARWAGDRTFRERLLLILHVGYVFVPLGLLLHALAVFGALPPSAGIHAWMAGAAGTMTLAVMTRASLGHTGQALTASPATQAIYAAIIVLRTLIRGVDIPGYASLLVVVLFIGSIQLIGIGVLGEYIGRIYMESKQRPGYIVRKSYGYADGP
jgi:uncharacterized protein involved in response to NO